MSHTCCTIIPAQQSAKPTEWTHIAGITTLVVGIALLVFGACLATGVFGPGIQAHISSYLAAGCVGFSIIPLAVAASILCRTGKNN